jgi:hypothetical protein
MTRSLLLQLPRRHINSGASRIYVFERLEKSGFGFCESELYISTKEFNLVFFRLNFEKNYKKFFRYIF